MKKIISLLLAALLTLSLAACERPAGQKDPGKLSVVATIFPEYDWVRQILGDRLGEADLVQLLDNGVDLHSYQPTVDDIVRISGCDLFIYVGGESDKWVADALKQAPNPDRIVISLMDTLGAALKEEEHKEGMEDHDEEEEDEAEFDEHVWLSLRNAQVLCAAICDALCALDADHAEEYRQNTTAYRAELAALDEEYTRAVEHAGVKTLLFADRFPFRYLTEDYGLDYYAAFAGCSAETEASFETVAFLAGKADELGLRAVCTIETSDGKIAQTVVGTTKNKNQTVLTLDSMQSKTSKDAQAGVTYLSLAKSNLEVLRQAIA